MSTATRARTAGSRTSRPRRNPRSTPTEMVTFRRLDAGAGGRAEGRPFSTSCNNGVTRALKLALMAFSTLPFAFQISLSIPKITTTY
jgi:hypothetical protein